MKIARRISVSILRPYSRKTKTAEYLQHYGVKGMKWGVRKADAIKIADTRIYKSIGTKARNYDIVDKSNGKVYHFSEGSKIQNSEVFAGKGTSRSLKQEVQEGLVKEIGGKPEKWQHCKGRGILDCDGEERPAEVHWFQEESVGKHKFKVKKWLDE